MKTKKKAAEAHRKASAAAALMSPASSDGDDELKLVRHRELEEFLGISKPTLTEWRRSGVIDEPGRFGPRLIGWTRAYVRRWYAERPKA